MRKSLPNLIPLLGLLTLVVIVISSIFLINNPNFTAEIRRRASGESLAVTLSNSSTKIQPNQAVTVDLMINTQGKFISGVQFSGKISGVNLDESGLIIPEITGLNPIFSEAKKVGDLLEFKFVELAVLGGTAYTTHDNAVKIATFNLYPKANGEVKIDFDQANSGAMEFEKSFLTSSVDQKSYQIEISTGGTGGGTTTSTPAPPDAGIHRGCNEYCADSRECASEFSCWYNRCRNPRNVAQEQCQNPVVINQTPATVTTTKKTSTKGGTTVKPSPTPLTTLARVYIVKATPSAQIASISARPSPSPRVSTSSSTITTRNLGKASPTPSPTVQPAAAAKGPSLGFLIGAALVTGILGIVAILFFLRNRSSGR